MKRSLLYCLLILNCNILFGQDLEANKGLYFGLKTGYTIPVAKTTIGSPRNEVGDRLILSSAEGNYSESIKNPFGSRGAGATVAANIGYMFNDNFGVEMEFSFLRSTKILDASRDETIIDNTISQRYFAEQYSYTNMFRVSPLLVVSGDPNKKFTPYAKFGILLPLAGKTIVEVSIADETGELAEEIMPVLNTELYEAIQSSGLNIPIATSSEIKAKTSGAFSVGFAARIGGVYNINEQWGIFSEMEMNMLSILAKETEFTEFNAKVPQSLAAVAEGLLGLENIQYEYGFNDLPEILRLTQYQAEITEASNSLYIPSRKNEPYEQLAFRDNYNSFGIMVGVKYRFK